MDKLCQDILNTQVLSDEMVTVEYGNSEFGYVIDEILGDNCTDARFSFPMVGISSDMVFIVQSEDAAAVADILEAYRLERYEAYMGYAPEEAEKIKNGYVDYCGDYAILLVLADVDSAVSVWNSAINQQ